MAAPLARLLAWDSMANSRTLVNRDGSLMACLRYRGPDLYSAMESELIVQAEQLNNCFKRLEGGWGILSEARRRDVRWYPTSTWKHPAAQLVDEERRERFQTPALHFETESTLTLTYKPRRRETQGLTRLLYQDLPPAEEGVGVPQFEEQVRRTQALLSEACEEIEQLEDSALLTYLHSTVSWKEYAVRVPDPAAYLNTYLADTDLERVYVPPSLFRLPKLGDRYLRCVSARAYPNPTTPGMLDVLDTLPLEYRATLRYLPLARAAAIKAAQAAGDAHWGQRHRGKSTRTERAAMTREEEAAVFQQGIELGKWSSGGQTQTIVVWDTSIAGVKAKAEIIEGTLNNAGYTAKVEGLNTMAAWDGSLPGNVVSNRRKPVMTSQNVARLIQATSAARGPRWNTHLDGPPLLMTTGRGQTPFALDLHDDDTAHTMLIGPTGSGKSLLLALLCLQWLKYPGAQVYIFDKDQSAKAVTFAVGGTWFDLGREIEKTSMSGTRLDAASTKPWGALWEPPRGWWQCFETASLLNTPDMVPKILAPLARQLEQNLTGVPSLIAMDEAWRYLDLDFFKAKIQDYFLTLRKANGTLLFSTQNLEHITKSSIGGDIFQSCVTKIYMPNKEALTPAIGKLYRDIGLTDRECYLIATMARKRQYYYTGVHGKCVFELGVGPVQLAFCGSSRKRDLAAIDTIYAQDPTHFARNWLTYKGLDSQASTLAEYASHSEDDE